MEEIWKPVKGYEGLYDLSNEGQYYSYPRHHSKGGYSWGNDDGNGYLRVSLSNKNIIKHKRINRLVWETFVGEIPKGYDVHHINHNRSDNRLENLKLIKQTDHARQHLLEHPETIQIANKAREKIILQYTKDGQFVADYPSMKEAQKQTGIHCNNISRCCLNIRPSAGGFVWKYKEVV